MRKCRLLAILLALLPFAAAAAEIERLGGAAIAAAVAGHTLTGYWQNAQVVQFFAADGRALRRRNREAVAEGRWHVAGDLLCADYPAIAEARCYRVQRQRDKLVLFEAETGYPLHAAAVPGNLLAGLGPAPSETAPPEAAAAAAGARETLARADLMAGAYVGDGPVDNAHFMPAADAGPAQHRFSGRIEVPDFALQGRIELGRGYEWFPGFEAGLASDGETLRPETPDLLRAAGSTSGLFVALSPGRVWSEPGDGGLSRAAFPFLLASPANRSAHNGIATFLYDNRTVSALRVQLVQEVSESFKIDAWGQTAMAYRPGPVALPPAPQPLPVRPFAELPGGAAPESFAAGAGGDLSTAGLVLDGTLYLLPCRTRHGPFPFCQAMRHEAGAMATALAALPALLRLAERFGAWTLDQRVAALLPEAADGWARVTLADALDMASGIGEPAPPNILTAAEMNARRAREAPAMRDKLGWVFRDRDGPAAPGAAFNFREGDTLVLAAALQAFLEREAGPGADLWDEVEGGVLLAAGIRGLPVARSVEADGTPGQALLNGLYPDAGDVARLAGLLHRRGEAGGERWLHAPPLERLLDFRAAKGLDTGVAGRRYFMGFWLWPYARADGSCRLWLPVASGGLGQLVVLLPHGMTAFRFADDRRLPVVEMARAADRVRPFCP